MIQNIYIYIFHENAFEFQENAFKNDVWKMVAILSSTY